MHRRCLSLLAKGCGTMALTFVPYMTKQGPVPEICQKLCYAQPHVAPRPAPRQRRPSAQMWGNEGSCEAL
jgi:hypothetical protein